MTGVLYKLTQNVVLQAAREGTRKLFSKYLLITNMTLGFSLAATGDLLNQRYEKLSGFRTEWTPLRTRNQCIQGLVFGSTYHFWYIFLDRILPGYSARVVVKKVFIDQLIMAPLSVVVFLSLLGKLEGQGQIEILKDVKDKGRLLLAAEWTLGPVTQIFNFFLLPTRFRVLYDSFICLSFDAYYIYIKYRHGKNSVNASSVKTDDILNNDIMSNGIVYSGVDVESDDPEVGDDYLINSSLLCT